MTPEPTPLVTVLPCEADIAAAKACWDMLADAFNDWYALSVDEQEALIDAFARHAANARLAALEAASPAMRLASNWLRACSDWLLSNDLDMKMPAGVLDADPLDIADALDAIRALSNKGGRDGE